MNLFFVFSFLFQLATWFHPATVVNVNATRVADTIYWQQSRKLTWDDFRGRPERSGETVALTSSGIGMVFRSGADGVAHAKVTCTFFCKNSWVKDIGRNDTVLQHEQLHFDITELYARKLRQTIDELPETKVQWPTLQKIYTDINRDCNERQNNYDHETNHGIIQPIQESWNDLIAKELSELKQYKSGD
jgi:hypothetical protein